MHSRPVNQGHGRLYATNDGGIYARDGEPDGSEGWLVPLPSLGRDVLDLGGGGVADLKQMNRRVEGFKGIRSKCGCHCPGYESYFCRP